MLPRAVLLATIVQERDGSRLRGGHHAAPFEDCHHAASVQMEVPCRMATLNLGILAHVDAGKTSLTERILYETGVIAALGSVDQRHHADRYPRTGTRPRASPSSRRSSRSNSTIVNVNLIDTPGHADFIAEVARALRVLDGVILVISAVEGVQPQTHRLARRSAPPVAPAHLHQQDRPSRRRG